MRMEFVVRPAADGWRVTRGQTSALHYSSLEDAVNAAETFARLAADRGERALVKVARDEGLETRSFEPEVLRPVEVGSESGPRKSGPGRPDRR